MMLTIGFINRSIHERRTETLNEERPLTIGPSKLALAESKPTEIFP